MASRAIKRQLEDTMLTGWESMPEKAPSDMREDTPTFARILSSIGLLFIGIGAVAMVAPALKLSYVIGVNGGAFCFTLGLALVFFHAFAERDVQFRRIYALVGLVFIGNALALQALPFGGRLGGLFVPYGIPGLFIGLLFELAVLRNETEKGWRSLLSGVLVGVGMLLMLGGAIALVSQSTTYYVQGVLLLFVGLLYVAGFVGMQDATSDAGYKTGIIVGAFGLLLFVSAIAISWYSILSPEAAAEQTHRLWNNFLVPNGWVMIFFGLAYMAYFLGVVTDWPLVVLTRRELASYFYSPVAYLTVFAVMVIGWLTFFFFVSELIYLRNGQMLEPIVRSYVIQIIPVFGLIFVVPIVTMRLLSEEHRTGTLEVLLTAPVNEATIVFSKFFAALMFYLLSWVPWFLFLVSLRVVGGEEFDYRPLIAFFLALIFSGAGFVAMGLFFSSCTRNQIIAAVLTFVVMMFYLGTYFARIYMQMTPGTPSYEAMTYISFLDLWDESLNGTLSPRYLLFHLSAAIFFLFMTVKVLESRKWR